MKRLIIMCSLLSMFGLFTNAFALDSFLSYRNLSVVGDEDTATTPETNFAIKQGYIYTNVLAANVAEVITVPAGEDEKSYIPREGCRELRVDCREQQAKDNIVICNKIDEIKTFLIALAEKRNATRDSNSDKFSEIRERLAKIETNLYRAI